MDQDLKRSGGGGGGGGGGGKCCLLFSPNHTYGSDSEDEEAHMQQLQLQTSSKHLQAKRAVSPSTFSQAKSESKISFTLSSKDTSNTTIQRSPSQEYTMSSQLITEPEKSINSFYNNNETMTSSAVGRIINDGPVLSESHKLLNSV